VGCEEINITKTNPTATSQETMEPKETEEYKQSIEEEVLHIKGLEIPFNYNKKENAIDSNMVVISDGIKIDNTKTFDQFYNDYQNGTDSHVIIVNYVNDQLVNRYAILLKNGHLEGELIKNNDSTHYILEEIYREDGYVYGAQKNDEPIVLIQNIGEGNETKPVPVDISKKLEWALQPEAVEIRWYIANTINKMNGTQKSKLDLEQNEDIIRTLLSEPVYYFDDVEEQVDKSLLDIRIIIEAQNKDVYFTVQRDGTIIFGFDDINYVSFSRLLFEKILNLINIDEFNLDVIDNVTSVTIYCLDSDNTVLEKVINDRKTIDNLVKYLKTSNIGTSRSLFKPSVQMILHAEDGDIICSFYGEDKPEELSGDIVINNFYWYNSQEAVDFARTLLE
jgi:hypothetical protein